MKQNQEWRKSRMPAPNIHDLQQAFVMKAATDAIIARLKPLVAANPCVLLRAVPRADWEGAAYDALAAVIAKKQELALNHEIPF